MDVLGIDLAKLTFDATLLTTTGAQPYASFPNTVEGFTQLQAWLLQHDVTALHACMEATNIYWEALATWLYQILVDSSASGSREPMIVRGGLNHI